ncbi:TetR/AcrR family transcriptional regulator [Nocardioides sp. GY 10127]|uniref:TetR/AcrR family transcriptional regulator n=1 Tax=Nocardioides sp. GY 10127 TaxID=2569762 RepID=UPI0010A91177|nr:TetR/AcrR family transcriptional regulator [Nocardioides sp. GY 10127]TIC82670.1 TetR/AcrR family transcriptional regulator [Nocardioides sp. GY 10127]
MTTRHRLLTAVRAACLEPGVDVGSLTVADLARRSGVHRVTFYRHWPDVPAAVTEAFLEEMERLSTVDADEVAAAQDQAALSRVYEAALLAQLRTVRDHRAIYRVLFAWPSFIADALPRLRQRAALMVEAVERTGTPVPGAHDGLAADFVSGAALAVLAAWVRSDSEDVEGTTAEIVALMPSWWPRPR